jgi:P27 family predicted phage terminase small subunit
MPSRSGPLPKPTALAMLHGTFNATRHGRDRAGEPLPVGDLSSLDVPEFFTDGQRASWDYVMAHAPRGLLKRIDKGVLALWCEAEDRWRVAVEQQAKLDAGSPMPLLAKGKNGPYPSPYLRIIRHAGEQMMQAARELGFTPAARPRLAGAMSREEQSAPANPWDVPAPTAAGSTARQ